MLVLTLDSANQVIIDGGITIQLPNSVKASQVRICIDAPQTTTIRRQRRDSSSS